eukprot:3416221-Rhodomonas_salina.1
MSEIVRAEEVHVHVSLLLAVQVSWRPRPHWEAQQGNDTWAVFKAEGIATTMKEHSWTASAEAESEQQRKHTVGLPCLKLSEGYNDEAEVVETRTELSAGVD